MRIVLIFFSLIWLAIGTWLSKSYLCDNNKVEKTSASALANKSNCDFSLRFAVDDFKINSKTNFEFNYNSDELVSPENVSAEVLNKVSQFLADNTDKTLSIDGLYSKTETNNTGQTTLGIARAASIKDYLVDNYNFNEAQLRLNSRAFKSGSCYNKNTKTSKKGCLMTFGIVE